MGAALVTGVGRRAGIGFAVARRLLGRGDRVVVSSWRAHDEGQSWGADDEAALLAELGDPPHLAVDLADPAAPGELVRQATTLVGPLTALVANHAHSVDGGLAQVTAAELDGCWAINARASVLLTQAFSAQYSADAGPGSVVLFTSGQHRGPMPGEIAYALSKAAIAGITTTLADAVGEQGIRVNCLNPGPTDTGWADVATRASLARRFPGGRWGTPDDAASIVAWLTSPDAASVTGQVIDAESGFRR